MSAQEDAAFAEYVKDLKSSLPSELHANLDAIAAHAGFKEVGFKGQIRQDEFHRRLNALKQEQDKFEADKKATEAFYSTEFEKNRKLITAQQDLEKQLNAAKGALRALGMEDQIQNDPPVNPTTPSNKDIEELRAQLKAANEKLTGIDSTLPHFLKDSLRVSHWIAKGNYEIDPGAVLDYSMQNRVTPEAAFRTLTADEDKKRGEVELQKKLDAAKEEGRKEALSKLPTPDFMGRRAVPGGSLSHLMEEAKGVDSRSRVQGASDMLREMLQKGEVSQQDLANP